MNDRHSSLRFSGSVWCNLDIALRNIDQVFQRSLRPFDLTVIEWYILRALYEQDGRHASDLAQAVGRAATSFTPNLDKLQNKGLIERRPDPGDRRAVRIYLTEQGRNCRDSILKVANRLDERVREMFPDGEFETFLSVVSTLQTFNMG